MTSAIGMANGMNQTKEVEPIAWLGPIEDWGRFRTSETGYHSRPVVLLTDYQALQQQLAAAREALQAAEVERDAWHHSSDKDLMRWRDAEEKLRRLQSQEGLMALANTLRQARHYVKHAVAHAPFAGNDPEVPMCVLNNVDAAISWLDYSEIPAATLQRDRQP